MQWFTYMYNIKLQVKCYNPYTMCHPSKKNRRWPNAALTLSVRGPTLDVRIWRLLTVYWRQILTSKAGPRTEIFLMAVDP